MERTKTKRDCLALWFTDAKKTIGIAEGRVVSPLSWERAFPAFPPSLLF